jgi:thiosulfate dehydrogenase [quinone] large subunit
MPARCDAGSIPGVKLRASINVRTLRHSDKGEVAMGQTAFDKAVLLLFRLLMGWTFLYAAIHHYGDGRFVEGFLSHTKTFHDIYVPLTGPAIVPILTFFVEYGHLLIGLSLISGLLVRVSAPFAIMMMMLYWTAHMDYPFIENHNNYLVDYHIVYALILLVLMVKNAGHVWGLDGWLSKHVFAERKGALGWAFG